MDNQKAIIVMSKCRFYLKFMHLGQKDEFHIGHLKIPNLVTWCILSTPLGIFILFEYLTLFDVGLNGFLENGNVFFISLGCTQLAITFICLTIRNKLIIKTIEHMQDIVDRSECSAVSWENQNINTE